MNRFDGKRFMRTFDSYSKIDLPSINTDVLSHRDTECRVKSWVHDDVLYIDGVITEGWCNSVIKLSEPHYNHMRDEYLQETRDSERFLTLQPAFAEELWSNVKPYFSEYFNESVKPYNDTDKTIQRKHVFTNRPSTPFGFGVKGEWVPLRINECFRFNKYIGSESSIGFKPHRDSLYVEDCDVRSIYTVLIYLNDLEISGETDFLQPALSFEDNTLKSNTYPSVTDELANGYTITSSIKPKAGLIAIMCHNRVHRGNSVAPNKTKYVVRSDVVFECKTRPENYSSELWTDSEEFDKAVGLYNDAKFYEMKGDVKSASECYDRGLAIRQNTYV